MSSLPQPTSTKTRQHCSGSQPSIRDRKASDPDFVLATTPEGWKGELEAWRALADFILGREEGPMLSLDQFVASLEGVEYPTEVAAFAACTRDGARHDATMRLERRTMDWRREFEAGAPDEHCLRGCPQALRALDCVVDALRRRSCP